jgi:hypothetical protein
MEEIDIQTKPEQALQSLIDGVADPELKQALLVIAKKLNSVSQDRNRVDWGIDGTTDADDSMCIIIGVVVW